MRTYPLEAERLTPHFTVPVSLRCPQETGLPTLPPRVLQGAAVSSECISQGPPGNVVASGCPPPLRRVSEQSAQTPPAGSPLQDVVLTAQIDTNPETSLERLVPLVEFLTAWKLLPNISHWVLQTIRKGYQIQFGSRPPRFMGVLSTEVAPQQVLAMEQEIKALLEKEAIEYVPHSNRETGFYSRYFIVPKKDGGLRPILDLRVLNVSVLKLKFKMLTLRQIVSQIRSEDWITIDLKDAYFHISILPYHRKFLRFAFGGKAYQYRVLPFGLALSPRTFTKCVDAALVPLRLQGIRIVNYIDDWLILAQSHQLAVRHRDVVLAHMEKLGLRLNAKKSVLSPLQRTTFLGVIWDSTSMQARLSPARIESILSAVKRIRLGQSLTVRQFQRLLGLMAAASNVIPVGLLHMRPLQWWLRTKGFSPRGNPFRMIKVTRRCLGNVEETLVPVPGSHVGSFMSSQDANDRCFSHGLGSDLRGTLRSRSVEGPSSLMAHQPSGDVGCVSCSQEFPSRSQGPPCACPLRQHIGGLLHKSPGGFAVTSTVQTGVPNPPVVPREVVVSASNLHPWGPQYRSRHPVETGAEARGMEASPRGGGADMEEVRPGTSGSVCVSRDVSLPTLVLPHASSSSRTGCDDTDVAEASSVCISPDCSAPRGTGESSPGPGPTTSYCPAVAGQSMIPKSILPSRRASSGAPRQEGPSVPSGGLDISPPSRTMETVGLASEGAQLINSGLSTEVVETILHSRAPSTRKLYALKWKIFASWCSDHQLDPVNCPVGTVLEFLQDRFTAGLAPSTLKVYVAAISAYHIPLGGTSMGNEPLVSRFLHGTMRLRPAARTRVPTWDLAIVLQGLSLAPFEPLEEVPAKFLTLKALFLLAISSLKRIGDLQALSVAPSCLEFAPGMVKAFLHPKPGYIPKVPANVARSIMLQAFCPPPFQDADQERHNLLCPVRALDAYVHRAALWRKNGQLFICFGPPNQGSPASKQRMSKWVVEAISLAYESAGQPSPMAVRSHSTRSMAASKALISGVTLQEVCDAAGWSSPHTFVRFYSLDLDSTPGSQVLSS